MLEVNGVTKKYYTKRVETTAVNNVTMKIDCGDFIAIQGSSGSGKSSFLSLIGSMDKPDVGSLKYNGKQVFPNIDKKILREFRRDTAYIFQDFKLLKHLSIKENIALPLAYSNIPQSEHQIRVDQMLERVGIAHRSEHYPSQLSGGQQQRVAIARALIREPKIIFADEPTGNLDADNAKQIMSLLFKINKAGTAIVLVTHDASIIQSLPKVWKMEQGSLKVSQEMLHEY